MRLILSSDRARSSDQSNCVFLYSFVRNLRRQHLCRQWLLTSCSLVARSHSLTDCSLPSARSN